MHDATTDPDDLPPEYAGATLVHQADVALLLACVRARFMDGQGSTIVLAIEGLKWLAGEESIVIRAYLEEEHQRWQSQGGADATDTAF